MSSCDFLGHLFDFSEEVFSPSYPPGVTPEDSFFDLPTREAALILWQCKEAVVGNEIVPDFRLVTFSGYIRALTEDENLTASRYLFQAYTNSQSLVENASRLYGLQFTYVDSIPVERMPLPTPIPSDAYSFSVPPGANADFTMRGQWWHDNPATHKALEGYYFLNATGELNHFRIRYEGGTTGSSGGQATFGPDSYWAQHSETESWGFVNGPMRDTTAEMKFYPGI